MSAYLPVGTKKILIVDDDPISVHYIESLLKNTPYQTRSAMSGEGAWNLLLKEPAEYSLLILDRIMLGLDGLELLKKIRAHHDTTKLPVIMITADAETDDFINAMRIGASEFMHKPLDRKLLLYIIRKCLNNELS